MVQTWDGEKLILKSWIFLVDHFNMINVIKLMFYIYNTPNRYMSE